jgi:phage terminase small subunit
MKLTAKQEAFALKYVECGDASEAYRHAYDAESMKPSTIHSKACLTLKVGKVGARVAELEAKKTEIAESALSITLEQRMDWLKQIVEAGLSKYEDQSSEKYHSLSAANQAVSTLNTMLGVDEKADKAKPVKVVIGVQDASKP